MDDSTAQSTTTWTTKFESEVYRKVTWRMIPFLFLCYIFAYVDRVNVGFAKLQMQQDLGISDAVYGTGAGIFFIGYFFFRSAVQYRAAEDRREVLARPHHDRLGPGVRAAPCLCRSEVSFYAVRFLLGVVESGFFPGVILYPDVLVSRKLSREDGGRFS